MKPTIDVNWEQLKKANILDSDFYLADLFVDDKDTNQIDDDSTIRDSLFVVFQNQGYKIAKENIKQMFDAAINPFTEQEVNAKEKFESNFMTDFIGGKIKTEHEKTIDLFNHQDNTKKEIAIKREFSAEAKAVFDAGRGLWNYYHSQKEINVNASFYDIREYFQGRNDKGIMKSKSADEKYTTLIAALREKMNRLADKITPKIYEYEFLKD